MVTGGYLLIGLRLILGSMVVSAVLDRLPINNIWLVGATMCLAGVIIGSIDMFRLLL